MKRKEGKGKKTRGYINFYHYICRVPLVFLCSTSACFFWLFLFFSSLLCVCVCVADHVCAVEERIKRVSCPTCMSVYCVETYCGGGIGEIANPLQWPQLRKRRRHHRLLLVVPPTTLPA